VDPTTGQKRSFLDAVTGSEHTLMTVLAVLVGVAGGFGAIGFRELIQLVQTLAYGSEGELLAAAEQAPWYMRFWLPAAGGLIVGPLIYFFAKEARGHGVPEVMEAVALRSGVIRKRVAFVKILASAVCIGSGGSVGREGPIVQIGSSIGSGLGQVLKVSPDRVRTLVGCGASAGIAATFNAPIAGSMFALEIVLGEFGLGTFSPIVISAVTATAVSRHFLGDAPAFLVPAYQLVSAWELPIYATLGLFCSLAAVFFTKALYAAEDLFEKVAIPEILKVALGGLLLGLMALEFPHILGVGYPAIDRALAQELSWVSLFLLIPLKILATSVTLGSGGSGGIFAPSLFVGAMAGGCFGNAVHRFFPSVTASPGAYSIVAMGAVVSGTTHGPMSAILILFEMTGDYKIILPLMIACIMCTLASRALEAESIYTLKLARRGVNIRSGREVNVLRSIKVGDVMNTAVETVPENLTLGDLAGKITKSKYNSFPVLDAQGRLAGILSFRDYSGVLFDENLKDLVVSKDLATRDVVTISTEDDLYEALERFSVRDFSTLPVVSPDDQDRLVGILTRRDIIGAYDKAVVKKSLLPQGSRGGGKGSSTPTGRPV